MSVQIGTTRPARRMFMPAQFVAQGGVMTMAGRMQKGHGITRAAYFHHIFQLKLSQRLGIEIHVNFAPVDDLDRNPRMIWQDDRAVRKRMRRNWTQYKPGKRRMKIGPGRRKGKGG